MTARRWPALSLIGLWAALVLTVWLTRPLLPIDETRYASVAWEMWLRQNFLVPHVNGVPYPDKPPLLFWSVLLGWKVLGVKEWWLRLVPPLFALGTVFLAPSLARRLWPGREELARAAPWVLLGTVTWSLYGTLFYFDVLVAFFAALGLLGVLWVWQRGGLGGWLVLGLAIGLGILSKGPVMLLYVLPPTLLAPWWGGGSRRSWVGWYLGTAGAVALGVAIALGWALPAAHAGGPAYADQLLWRQTADRLVHGISHQRPIWWYLPWLPVIAFPWCLSPAVWRGSGRLARAPRDAGVRFCLAWLVPGLVAFSLISGKQLHYLIPLFPAFALLVARTLVGGTRRLDQVAPAAGFLAVALLLLAVPAVASHPSWLGDAVPFWLEQVAPSGGLLLVLATVGLGVRLRPAWRVPALTLASVLWLIVLHASVMRLAAPAYDVKPVAERLHRWQDEGRPIVNMALYHSQFQFFGRLERPIGRIEPEQVRGWIEAHPRGKVIAYHKQWPLDVTVGPDFTQRYRGRILAVWGRRAILAAPAWPPPPLERSSSERLPRRHSSSNAASQEISTPRVSVTATGQWSL